METYILTPEESIKLNMCRWLSISDCVVDNHRPAPDGSDTEMLADVTHNQDTYVIGYDKLDLATIISNYDFTEVPVLVEGEQTPANIITAFTSKYGIPVESDMLDVTDTQGMICTLTVKENPFIKGTVKIKISTEAHELLPKVEFMLNGTLKNTGTEFAEINTPVVFNDRAGADKAIAFFPGNDGMENGGAIPLGRTLMLDKDWTIDVVIEGRRGTYTGAMDMQFLTSVGGGTSLGIAYGKINFGPIGGNWHTGSLLYYNTKYRITVTCKGGLLTGYVDGRSVGTANVPPGNHTLNSIGIAWWHFIHSLRYYAYGMTREQVTALATPTTQESLNLYRRPFYEWCFNNNVKNTGVVAGCDLTNTDKIAFVDMNGYTMATCSGGFDIPDYITIPHGNTLGATYAIDLWYHEFTELQGILASSSYDEGKIGTQVFIHGMFLRPKGTDRNNKPVLQTTILTDDFPVFRDKPNRIVLVLHDMYKTTCYVNGVAARAYLANASVSDVFSEVVVSSSRKRKTFGYAYHGTTCRLNKELKFSNFRIYPYPMTPEHVLKNYNDEPYDE